MKAEIGCELTSCELHLMFWVAILTPYAGIGQELGADEVVDYSTQRVDELYKDKPFDVVIDPVGGACCSL